MCYRNLPIIKNKLLNKFAPKISSMKISYYHVIVLSLFALGMILVTKDGLRSIGFIVLILSLIGYFLGDSLNEVIQIYKLTESRVWVSRIHCIEIIGTNTIAPILIVVCIIEILKT